MLGECWVNAKKRKKCPDDKIATPWMVIKTKAASRNLFWVSWVSAFGVGA